VSRLAAYLRHQLGAASAAELRALRREVAGQGQLWTLTALERQPPPAYLPGEATADLDRALAKHGSLVPLVPMPPLPPPAAPPPGFVALCWAMALAALLAAGISIWPGCTIRGGACGSEDSCAPGESCIGGRCMVAPRPRPVPAPGGPI
jgi:hypothetical protein